MRADSLAEFASSGVYCQFDLFGIENSYYQFAEHIDWPSDAQRMDYIMRLVREEGRGDKVLVAHDIHTKHRLVSWKKSLKKSTIQIWLSRDDVELFSTSICINSEVAARR